MSDQKAGALQNKTGDMEALEGEKNKGLSLTLACDDLRRRIKQRYEPGPAQPALVLFMTKNEAKPEGLRIGWQYYAGMGNAEIMPAQPAQRQAAEYLCKKGEIAPARVFTYHNDEICPLKLIEDLNWGIDANNGIVQYELQGGANLQDMIIRDDKIFAPAINAIRARLAYGHAAIDSPIRVQDEEIRPVIMNLQYALIRARQIEFNNS